MIVFGLIFAGLLMGTAPVGNLKQRCEARNGKACYALGVQEFYKIPTTKLYADQENLKDIAGTYMRDSCDFGYRQGCAEYENYNRYIEMKEREDEIRRGIRHVPIGE